MELLLKNGHVYDPLNDVNGDKMDIAIRDGKIVDRVKASARTLDVSRMIVMPGGVDIHSHIAGPKVNKGRELRPEDHLRHREQRSGLKRAVVGYVNPTSFTTGYWYANLGYTTVLEPATAPLETRHTHEELSDVPILDKACFPLMGSNWFVLDYLSRGDLEGCMAYVAWLMRAVKGYAVKIVSPGSLEAWGWGRGIRDLDAKIPEFDLTPRDIVRGLCRVNLKLGLPSPIHVHCNDLGAPGNYTTTLDTMRCVEGLAKQNQLAMHVVHVQFNAYSGSDWSSFSSGASKLAKYVNSHTHVSTDLGQVIFGDTTTMTADGPWQYILYGLTGNRWVNHDVEAETGGGIVPYEYRRKNYVNAVQWVIGLEFALQVKDPWKVCLTTDHPNGGPFIEYPRIMTWLLSREARDAAIKRINKRARKKTELESLEREYTLSELAVVTRASAARIAGLKDKGHLGPGSDADLAIYDIDPVDTELSKDYRRVRKALRNAAYTIKEGEIVSKAGEIVSVPAGRTYYIEATVPKALQTELTADLKARFEDYYTVKLENYPVHEEYLRRPVPMKISAGGP